MTYINTDQGRAVGADFAAHGLFWGHISREAAPPKRFGREQAASVRVISLYLGLVQTRAAFEVLTQVCEPQRWLPPEGDAKNYANQGHVFEDLPFRGRHWIVTVGLNDGDVNAVELECMGSLGVSEAWREWEALGDLLDQLLDGSDEFDSDAERCATVERWRTDDLEVALEIQEQEDAAPTIRLMITSINASKVPAHD